MNVLARVTAFTATLVVLGGAAAAVGASVGPVDTAAPTDHAQHAASDDPQGAEQSAGHGAGHGAGEAFVGTPAGLQVTEQGLTLRLLDDRPLPSPRRELRFRIIDEQGATVTDFEASHGKPLHLIVVRRDLESFQHVHPRMAADGTWSVEVDLSAPGTYRAFADFRPVGAESGLTLGQDLFVPGRATVQPLAAPSTTATVGAYDVELAGTLVPGETSRLTLTVTRDGEPVTDLQPYLEAYGHLVALRAGDLAYLHVHPEGAPGDGTTPSGPDITFYAEVPSAGAYRLYLDFKHGDEVRTAAFTAVAGPGATGSDEHSGEAHTH